MNAAVGTLLRTPYGMRRDAKKRWDECDAAKWKVCFLLACLPACLPVSRTEAGRIPSQHNAHFPSPAAMQLHSCILQAHKPTSLRIHRPLQTGRQPGPTLSSQRLKSQGPGPQFLPCPEMLPGPGK